MRPLLTIVSLCLCFYLTRAQEGEQPWCDQGIGHYALDMPGADDCSFGLFHADAHGNPFTNRVSGHVFANFQSGIGCSETTIHHSQPIAGQLVIAENDQYLFSTLTDENGEFIFFIDTGTFTLRTIPILPGLIPCSNAVVIQLTGHNVEIEQDFVMDQIDACDVVSIDISAPFLQPCSLNSYRVKVCNQGAATQYAPQ
ncbi:MAG: hypothetical protein AAFV80_17695, partial [Bacteroidota bacterium]